SVSQICDNENSVLFIDSECIVLGRDYKLLDDANILLRTPRQHNMYSIDLNNIIPHKDLTCLVAKASADECILWHMRLGHLNVKTINKLVRHNLVIGLPTKSFDNDHTCTTCLKGKQHKVSCKSKLVNYVSKPLHTLHMDLLGPTSVSSISHKWYCLVVTDDFSKFTWTFFLRTKDETSDILKKFITEIENLKILKVKIIRCDNKGEFRNKEMNYFCSQKGIKREFSNARTPQQNGVAKRRNRTLIETARTMLADAKLPVTFWVEAVNIACYVQNRVLVNKSQNKTPYELFKVNQEVKKDVSSLRYIALPNWIHDAHLESSSKTLIVESPIPTVSSPVPTACLNDSPEPSSKARLILKRVANQEETPSLDNILSLTNKFEDILGVESSSDEVIGVEANAIRLFLAYASFMGFTVYQMNVNGAFLYGTIDEEVYVMQPPGFHDPEFPAKVYKVEKAMYGLHQAPRSWYGTLSKYLLMHGFQRGTIDQPLFIKRQREDFILVQVYVDDIIFGSSNPQLCKEFEALMHEKFQMSAMGELNFFLGLQVLQKEDGIFLSHDKYVGDILKKFGYSDVISSNTPMDKENPWGKDGTRKDVDLHLYRSMIGSLMYFTASRPDIMFAGHPKLGLWYPKESPFDLVAYSDSDYGGATQDRKSTGGSQFLGRRLISWQCKKQTIVATSPTKVEYVAAASCCGQVLWIRNQLLDYGYNFMNTKIHIDNNSAIFIVKNLVYHSKTKHIEIRHHFIRDCFEKKLISVDHIYTDENAADLLTKPLMQGDFSTYL
nr:putative ribonuclease H-like domain-containing protein [Tanacetum cinerariifolium]